MFAIGSHTSYGGTGEAGVGDVHHLVYHTACDTCQSRQELEEDTDNPGHWYCRQCWIKWGQGKGVSDVHHLVYHTCDTCQSRQELEEDVDNPGRWYCRQCWVKWGLDQQSRTVNTASANVEDRSTSPTKRAKLSSSAAPRGYTNASARSACNAVAEDSSAIKQTYADCLRDCDKSTYGIPEQAFQRPNGWADKKGAAAEATIELLSKLQPTTDNLNYNSSSSEDDIPGAAPQPPKVGLSRGEKTFIRALPYCIPLDAGFHVTPKNGSGICFCPCGPNLRPWRGDHNIIMNRDQECSKASFTPNALMDHLKKKGGKFREHDIKGKVVERGVWDIYHHAAEVYLKVLYTDWHGQGK